jgi:hypothetical protein
MEPIETDQAEFVRIIGVLSELDLEDRAALIINLLAWFMLGMRVNHRDAMPDAARMPVLAGLAGAVVRTHYDPANYDEAITRFSVLLEQAVRYPGPVLQ